MSTIALVAMITFLGPWLLVGLVGLTCWASPPCRRRVHLFLFGSDAPSGRPTHHGTDHPAERWAAEHRA
ncbi:hypothetical protein [Sphingomonas lenta]|uniref:Uncharacterized protein n=1 Tax=Sphingomonas lenta TaxID=1141887 RepID=A0A2A2SBA8_9SPHN|nr:hypothetical protein [Sphingomonas lenta]PAX06539.1 hypothetical protein CKY28_15405 [Sphingomonas lenta]